MESGKIIQIIGPVVDIEFGEASLPAIYDALKVESGKETTVLETARHLGSNRVRAIAMSSTDGLVRGMNVIATGAPLSVPVGKTVLGHLFNVLGEPLDDPKAKFQKLWPIHRKAPLFTEQSTKTQVFETGI